MGRLQEAEYEVKTAVSLGFGMSGKMSGDRVRRQVPQLDNVTAPRSSNNGEACSKITLILEGALLGR